MTYITFLIVKNQDYEKFGFLLDKSVLIGDITSLEYKHFEKNGKTYVRVLSNLYLEPNFFLKLNKPFMMIHFYNEHMKFFNNFVS